MSLGQCDPGSAAATNRVAVLVCDTVELADVPQLFERWLAGRPLADRSRREYARNVRVYCAWLAETCDREGWHGDPLDDPLARDHAASVFDLFEIPTATARQAA